MADEIEKRYAISLSLEEVASGCRKVISIKTHESCSSCSGSGKTMVGDPGICPKCQGSRQVYTAHPASVDIPAGIPDGYLLRTSTHVTAGQKVEIPEKIDVLISLKVHKVLSRENADLIYELPLNFSQAALGTEALIPLLKGEIKLKIPPGTQTGKVFRLKGKGLPHFHEHGKGDLLVKITVLTPTALDEHQRELLQQLSKKLPQPQIKRRNRQG